MLCSLVARTQPLLSRELQSVLETLFVPVKENLCSEDERKSYGVGTT